jgi:hypothetical protein
VTIAFKSPEREVDFFNQIGFDYNIIGWGQGVAVSIIILAL